MKKVFYFLMSVAMLGMMSCTSCKHDEKPVFNGYDFEKVMAEDQEAMVAKYGDSVVFYEAQAWYKDVFTVVDSNYIVKMRNVFQYQDTSVTIFHFADSAEIAGLIEYADSIFTWHEYKIDTNEVDYTFTLIVNDYWVEDQVMNLANVNVTLDSALTIIRGVDQEIPNSVFVVMRQPLFPPFPTAPYYIFGDNGNYIGISSETGEVVTEF